MSIAPLDRPAPVLSRVASLRHTSPGRLQLLLALLVTVGVLTGLAAGVTAYAARAGTTDLGERSQPLLVEAETIYSRLADADTTAAQAFLTGGLEPTALVERYNADIAAATTALTSAARRTPATGKAADAVQALSAGIPRYTALVAAARANNRQGNPVGAAYLSAASTLNRDQLQQQADTLFRAAYADVDAGYGNARSLISVSIFALLIMVLLVVLIRTQRYLSRTTQRTFNVPLVIATGVTLVLALTAGGLLTAQETRLHSAAADGSRPVAELAYARILALRERADEALTLVARAGKGPLEADFTSWTQPNLSKQLDTIAQDVPGAAELAAQHSTYLAARAKARALDDGGNYDGAVAQSLGADTTGRFTTLTDGIGALLNQHRDTFTQQIDRAGFGLGPLIVLGPLLALVVCLLAVFGIRARLEEYR